MCIDVNSRYFYTVTTQITVLVSFINVCVKGMLGFSLPHINVCLGFQVLMLTDQFVLCNI